MVFNCASDSKSVDQSPKRFCVNCGRSYVPPRRLCLYCNTDPTITREAVKRFLRNQREGFIGRLEGNRLVYPGEHASFGVAALATIFAFLALSVASLGVLILLVIIGIVLQKIHRHGQRHMFLSVGEHNFPDIDALVDYACFRLEMPRPDVYVQQDVTLNAHASGFLDGQWIVLNSALVRTLDPQELMFVIGHELGHIRFGHTTLLNLISNSGSHPIPLMTSTLVLIFKSWSRKAEYTADRAGLIVCGNVDAASTALMKILLGADELSQVQIQRLLEELKRCPPDRLADVSEYLSTHPLIPKRILAIQEFEKSDVYSSLSE